MAQAHRKTAVAKPQDKVQFKGVILGPQIAWPRGEKMPTNLKEAFSLGWKFGGGCGEGSADGQFEEGTDELTKRVGKRHLTVKIRYRSVFTWGKPYSPTARVMKPGTITLKPLTSALTVTLAQSPIN